MHTSAYIGLGANLSHERFGSPRQTLEAALAELARRGVRTVRVSPWYRTAPIPASDQPWYVNAVAEVESDLPADALLAELHAVEAGFGRARTVPNAARPIDLDLLDFHGQIAAGGAKRATLPHPRMTDRAFVLLPLADLAPEWRHPVSGLSVRALIEALPADQVALREPLGNPGQAVDPES
ncbi:2-amino-4-hydroxy-6-hydroxymethyldihydropteridine diphosphokinase [Reyranella sp.]|uniref:2-amino-4-hydroxy-6- hydroxymethyldihydropteridine diphosphokinase n=1 Tax=Reyranella sp. TaxID=1929291 RepID=UPI003D120FCA